MAAQFSKLLGEQAPPAAPVTPPLSQSQLSEHRITKERPKFPVNLRLTLFLLGSLSSRFMV